MVFLVQTGASPLCFGFASLAHIVTFLGLGLIIALAERAGLAGGKVLVKKDPLKRLKLNSCKKIPSE
jgi:hypothetical protein